MAHGHLLRLFRKPGKELPNRPKNTRIAWGAGIGAGVCAIVGALYYCHSGQTLPANRDRKQPTIQVKEQIPTYTNKIETKVEPKPLVKYTASMAHLIEMTNKSMTFTKKIDTKSGSITFEPTELTTEKPISCHDYYEYLKTNGDQQALKKFMGLLIEKIYADYKTMFIKPMSNKELFQIINDKNALNEFEEKREKCKQEIIQTLTPVLLNEETHPDKIVFYHGHKGALKFFHDFVSILHQYLDCTKKSMFRSRFEGKNIFALTDKNLKEFGNHSKANDWGKGDTLLSSNIALFGNLDDSGENTLGFAYQNSNMSGNYITYANNLAANIGLSIDNEMKNTMVNLYGEYAKLCGVLKQIFISPTYVDTLSYISHPLGIPYKFLSKSSNIDNQQTTNYWQNITNAKNSPELLNTSKIIEFIRTKKNLDRLNTYMLNRLQARIVCNSDPFTNPAIAEKYGIEIVDYFVKPEDSKTHEELRQKMDNLVQKILVTTLQQNTLQGDAAKTKLVEFYKNNNRLPTISELK